MHDRWRAHTHSGAIEPPHQKLCLTRNSCCPRLIVSPAHFQSDLRIYPLSGMELHSVLLWGSLFSICRLNHARKAHFDASVLGTIHAWNKEPHIPNWVI